MVGLDCDLDEGDVVSHADRRLFDGKVDSIEAHVSRKRALADQFRYSVLYLLYEYGEASRTRLCEDTGRDGNDLQHHLRELLDTNLIARRPAPEDADGRRTYYRVTTLGKQEIESDLEHIVGGNRYTERHRCLVDTALADSSRDDGRICAREILVDRSSEVDKLNKQRTSLRKQQNNFRESTEETQ